MPNEIHTFWYVVLTLWWYMYFWWQQLPILCRYIRLWLTQSYKPASACFPYKVRGWRGGRVERYCSWKNLHVLKNRYFRYFVFALIWATSVFCWESFHWTELPRHTGKYFFYLLKSPGDCENRDIENFGAFFNPVQDGGQKARPPTSFSALTSTKVRISPQNFLTFSFDPFERLV